MGTPLMWYAFGKTFEIYDNAISFPFNWNPSREQMYFNENRVPKSLFSISTMFLAFICCGANIWYLITIQSTWSSLNYVQIVVSLIQFLLCFIIISLAVYFTQNGGEMAALFTDSHRTMTDAVAILKVNYLLTSPPIYRDILGIIFAVGISFTPLVFMCILWPGMSVVLNLDPLFPIFRHAKSSSIYFYISILIRYLFSTFEFAVLVRWYCFAIMQLFLVLTIGNAGFDLLCDITKYPYKHSHLPQKPEKIVFIDDVIEMIIWQELVIRMVIIQRRIFLHTKFWSYNLGFIIFLLITIGIILWSIINYALLTMYSILPTEIYLFAIGASSLFCFLYVTLATFVTSIENGSAKLNGEFKLALQSHKLGRRYVNTLSKARISTPFFSFRRKALIGLIRIPFDVTMNLVLTFPFEI